ncbi:hypothetical protein LIER_43421 [Lithospermum erythrorhizon]|uniref:Uncharacterized protein n=1 Tax=Lithospermum erythrorhizon TaxID=34254 RepID=A0AAV3Q3U2_LITER
MDIYAQTFPNSVTGAALDGYMELPANSIDSYATTVEAFIAKYNSSITNKQDERPLMDLEQRPCNHGKLKKPLILDTPLTKDELTRVVNKPIDLENL